MPEFAAEARDVGLDKVARAEGLVAPYGLGDDIGGEHLAAAGQQQAKQVKFTGVSTTSVPLTRTS